MSARQLSLVLLYSMPARTHERNPLHTYDLKYWVVGVRLS